MYLLILLFLFAIFNTIAYRRPSIEDVLTDYLSYKAIGCNQTINENIHNKTFKIKPDITHLNKFCYIHIPTNAHINMTTAFYDKHSYYRIVFVDSEGHLKASKRFYTNTEKIHINRKYINGAKAVVIFHPRNLNDALKLHRASGMNACSLVSSWAQCWALCSHCWDPLYLCAINADIVVLKFKKIKFKKMPRLMESMMMKAIFG
uniref:Uncharacterized protein n=1 Tax=Acrobeloides nanus TaxID=290746 RepID=A0A914C6Z3_9BILA